MARALMRCVSMTDQYLRRQPRHHRPSRWTCRTSAASRARRWSSSPDADERPRTMCCATTTSAPGPTWYSG